MRKSRSKIALLPEAMRIAINRKLRDGWQYATIVKWLFAERAKQDVPDLHLKAGERYERVWTQRSATMKRAEMYCSRNLSGWYNSHYREWVREQAKQDSSVRLVDRMEELSQAAVAKGQPGSTEGGNLIIRSLLIEAIQSVCRGDNNPAHIARLANAWARMCQAGTTVESLKLRSQDAVDLALRAMYDEIKDNPAAIEQFNKLHELVTGAAEPSS